MSFASLCIFTYMYPVSFLSKCHAKNRKEVLAVRTSYRKEVLALLSCSSKEVLVVSSTQAQATRNQLQEELLLADAKRSSCVCIIFGLYCRSCLLFEKDFRNETGFVHIFFALNTHAAGHAGGTSRVDLHTSQDQNFLNVISQLFKIALTTNHKTPC